MPLRGHNHCQTPLLSWKIISGQPFNTIKLTYGHSECTLTENNYALNKQLWFSYGSIFITYWLIKLSDVNTITSQDITTTRSSLTRVQKLQRRQKSHPWTLKHLHMTANGDNSCFQTEFWLPAFGTSFVLNDIDYMNFWGLLTKSYDSNWLSWCTLLKDIKYPKELLWDYWQRKMLAQMQQMSKRDITLGTHQYRWRCYYALGRKALSPLHHIPYRKQTPEFEPVIKYIPLWSFPAKIRKQNSNM